ncbi:MAG: hypothetical protein K2F90_00525 [Clostridiales bacterium]|nr:hypothetical protein [Clostridiales bacterium]
MISCASAGIFSGYALAADKLDCAEYLYRNVNISNKLELFWKVFAKGLLSDYLYSLTAHGDYLSIPMCFPVCYVPILSAEYYWLYGGFNRVWNKYMFAAANYPFLQLRPSLIKGRLAIDGGAVDNIPLFPLLKSKSASFAPSELDLIVIMHFDSRYDYRNNFVTDTPILDLDLSYCNGFKKAHCDYSTETVEERLSKSYEYGNVIADKLFSGDCSRESLRGAIDEIFLREHAERQRNLSLDRFMTILNTVGRVLRKDGKCIKKLF